MLASRCHKCAGRLEAVSEEVQERKGSILHSRRRTEDVKCFTAPAVVRLAFPLAGYILNAVMYIMHLVKSRKGGLVCP